MRTPMLDRAPPRPTTPVGFRRHHRSRIVVVTGALTLLAVAAGAAVALTGRHVPAATPARPAAAASPTIASPAAATPTTVAPTPAPSKGNATPTQVARVPATGANPGAAPTRPVLADGTYPAYIRKIDLDRRTMVFDVIQVFEGEAAVKAAIQDGRSPGDAEYLSIYIRNQNSLLRTLPVARDASIKFLSTCEGPTATRAVLGEVAKHAAATGYYYNLTVAGGSVRRIVEHYSQPAC
jgi:hypothetical protein